MSCLVDNPTDVEIALATSLFITTLPGLSRQQLITLLSATLAALIAAGDDPREDLAEIEQYIEDRVGAMTKKPSR